MASLVSAPSSMAQGNEGNTVSSGLIGPNSLPRDFAAVLNNMGGRMTNAAHASISLSGTLTDSSGTRTANITVQANGMLLFKDNDSRTIAFDGTQFQAKNSAGDPTDQRIKESLLAQFPDMVLLQMAQGGSVRRLSGRFRSPGGASWRLYAFTPPQIAGLTAAAPLQQSFFIAIDDATGLMAETRVVVNAGGGQYNVTQTKYSNWFAQGGYMYPGVIARLEGGKQVLSLQVQSGTVGAAAPLTAFQP
jgi:hypothetical protein